MLAEFLRRKAADIEEIKRACFDLDAISRLRVVAEDLRAKAAELDNGRSSGATHDIDGDAR